MLHANVQRKPDGGSRAPCSSPHRIHQALVVEHALDPRKPAVVDADRAQHVSCQGTQGVMAPELGAEAQSRQAQLVHGLRLLWAQAARHPHEAAAPVGERPAQLGSVKERQHAGNLLGHLVEVLDHLRVRIERVEGAVGRHQAPLAIDDIGTRQGARRRLRARHAQPRRGLVPEAQELDGDGRETEQQGRECNERPHPQVHRDPRA